MATQLTGSACSTAATDHALGAEDSEVLRAVMAFLDDASDGETCLESRSPSPPLSEDDASAFHSSSEPCRQGRHGPKVINRSRMRRRHELLSLKEQAVALQARLDAIRSGNVVHESPEEAKARQAGLSAWQTIAEDQRLQLAEAEAERDQLRQQLKLQRYTIKRVEKFFRKLTLPEVPEPDKPIEVPVNPLSTEYEEGFEDITPHIPTMYLQLNAVFNDKRLESVVNSMRDIQIHNEQTPHMSIEALESRLLPFDVAAVAESVWNFQQMKARSVSFHVTDEEVLDEGDIMRRRFKANVRLPSYHTTAHGRMETRRFVENDRVVIVQSALIDQQHIAHVDVQAFSVRQFQWTVIRPARSERLRNTGKPLSQIETFNVAIPFLNDTIYEKDPNETQEHMKRLCIEAAQVLLEMEQQAVEDILMNLSISTR